MLQTTFFNIASAALWFLHPVQSDCPDYSVYSKTYHAPFSSGRYNLSYMRPAPTCRTWTSSLVEETIISMRSVIKDPDVYRLFENSFPNTLDTAVKWKGFSANNSEEELTFLITGDINAMWLRDSANQLQSYLSLLKADSSYDSLASLYRGVINLQARYIDQGPYCNAFQGPAESGLEAEQNNGVPADEYFPFVSNLTAFECKWELDSVAAFLQISTNYYEATRDIKFFQKFSWLKTIKTIMKITQAQLIGTYASNGSVNPSPYTWQRYTLDSIDTTTNRGQGNPVKGGTGLVRSLFRPSDDSTIFQLFIPANMMFSRYLESASRIMAAYGGQDDLAVEMREFSQSIKAALSKAIVHDPTYGRLYAFEIDGFGSHNQMDDANIPSLLSAPFFGFLNVTDPIYQATRNFVLSADNPYFTRGPVINAVGGPHDGPGYAWPMASIIRIFTSDDDDEIRTTLRELVSSTDGLGLIHESINSFNQSDWSRQWFSWANGLFGQCLLDLKIRKPDILNLSFQEP